jgi:hypothetical protein
VNICAFTYPRSEVEFLYRLPIITGKRKSEIEQNLRVKVYYDSASGIDCIEALGKLSGWIDWKNQERDTGGQRSPFKNFRNILRISAGGLTNLTAGSIQVRIAFIVSNSEDGEYSDP